MNSLAVLARRVSILAVRRGVTVAPALRVFRSLSTTPTTTGTPIPFAVEAPDGTSEALMDAELHEVEDIIDHAAEYEDPTFVEELHQRQQDAARVCAVDGPDGESEDMQTENLHAVDEVIDYAAEHEDKEKVRQAHQLEEAVRKAKASRAAFPDY